MNNKEFRKKLQDLDLTITEFAKVCGVGYSTAKDWKTIPKWVPFVLNYMQITQNLDIDHKDAKQLTKKLQALKEIKKITADI